MSAGTRSVIADFLGAACTRPARRAAARGRRRVGGVRYFLPEPFPREPFPELLPPPPYFFGRFLRLVLAIRSSSFSLIDSTMLLDAP
jgi:hypothetical protein